ncbi:cysteine proteinase inhibitor 1-like [Lycium ferocissimum]|uniref:cysteine proteinase inhibitor 1-like n=1 Tax=Lycium ferocissimum TaxID=112874 RepID=UPI002815E574|nr:cysteine proteinase inhibitor 1-like [Lycium ferocissimum]
MTFNFNSLLLVTLSTVVVASILGPVFATNDDRKLLDSFGRVLNSLAPSLSHGGWQPIDDTEDSKVVDVAEFAVSAENGIVKRREFEFLRVEDGKFRIDNNGITYQLDILATKFSELNEYSVVVLENSKDHVRKLISWD